MKTLTFRIPTKDLKKKAKSVETDPDLTWPIIKDIIPKKAGQDASNLTLDEQRALRTLKGRSSGQLPIPVAKIEPSPYEYYCTVNEDSSHITQPRLSVTKLLVLGWCELREFYGVFSGLHTKRTARLRTGVNHHEKLEKKSHPRLDAKKVDKEVKQASETHTKEELAVLFSTKMAHQLASAWSERVVTRLVEMAHTKQLREIQVHGFLNLETGVLAADVEAVADSVLVNGIVDIVSLDTQNHTLEEPRYESGEELPPKLKQKKSEMEQKILDLSIVIPEAKNILSKLAEDHYLHTCDVKTRVQNSIPQQASVLLSARDQCMFYGRFFHLLSRDELLCYESWLENGRRRLVDPDAPISVGFATELLLQQFNTLATDFLRLANGEPIGFEEFDKLELNSQSCDYSLTDFVTEEKFRELLLELYGPETPYQHLDLSPLFNSWKKPLTLRYFAARAAQAFNMFKDFKPGSVSVEYHNTKSNKLVKRIHYPFSEKSLENTINNSAEFWNGTKLPEGTDDLSKCHWCNFKNRCPVKNGKENRMFGDRLAKLLD